MTITKKSTKVILSIVLITAVVICVIVRFNSHIELSQWANISTIIGVVVTVGALIVAAAEYARKTKIDEMESRPYMYVSLMPKETNQNTFELVIKNTGKTLAKNIRINFDPDHSPLGVATSINNLKILRNIGFMTPKETRRYFFDNYMSLKKRNIKEGFRITITYSNVDGKEYKETFISNPTDYEGMIQNSDKSLNDIYKLLEELTKSYRKIQK